MSLLLLGALVIGGILGVVVLVHSFGWTGGAGFEDEAEVQRRFAMDYPDGRVDRVVLSADRNAAILQTEHGAGVVMRFGRGALTRQFAKGDLREVREQADGLLLRLRDDSAPRLRIALPDAAVRHQAKDILNRVSEA